MADRAFINAVKTGNRSKLRSTYADGVYTAPFAPTLATVTASFDSPQCDNDSASTELRVAGELRAHLRADRTEVHAGGRLGWIDAERVMMESLVSIRRAGAGMILTYFAKEAARIIG